MGNLNIRKVLDTILNAIDSCVESGKSTAFCVFKWLFYVFLTCLMLFFIPNACSSVEVANLSRSAVDLQCKTVGSYIGCENGLQCTVTVDNGVFVGATRKAICLKKKKRETGVQDSTVLAGR
jgi:hypothetical protein